MDPLRVGLAILLLLAVSFWGGQVAQRWLREAHRSRDTIDSVRVVITLLVTFAAIVMGMLITDSQTKLGSLEAGLRGLSIAIAEVDRNLREYGSSVDPLRAELIRYTKETIADTWRDETPPPGDYPHRLATFADGSVESVKLTTILHRIDLAIHHLAPDDDFHRSVAATLRLRMDALQDQRWNLIENAQPSLSWAFLGILMFWLAVIFLIAGLSSPRNLLVIVVAMLATVSIASSIYLAVDLDTPLSGFIRLSSAPLRDALAHLVAPPLPAGAP